MATLDELKQELELLNDAIRFYRVGMETLGSARLAYFIDSLGKRFKNLPTDVVVAARPVLEEVAYAQAEHDYVWLADLLEFELMPTIFPGFTADLLIK